MRGNSLKIDAKIENLKYESTLCQQLKTFGIDDFPSGAAFSKAAFLLSYKNNTFAISHWVSPKRTRSYPYARVYDTMNTRTRITIIPFLKKAIKSFMDLITEATKNNFLVFLMDSRTPKLQKEIVIEYLKRKK